MRKMSYLLGVLLLLSSVSSYAGTAIGFDIQPSLLLYDGLDSKDLQREARYATAGVFGVHVAKPIASGVFVSLRAGYGATLPIQEKSTISTGSREVDTHLQVLRAGIRLNLMSTSRSFLFTGGGIDVLRLRFGGDIPEINSDSNDPYGEVGFGVMLTDLHFIGVSGTFSSSTILISLNYTLMMFYFGY